MRLAPRDTLAARHAKLRQAVARGRSRRPGRHAPAEHLLPDELSRHCRHRRRDARSAVPDSRFPVRVGRQGHLGYAVRLSGRRDRAGRADLRRDARRRSSRSCSRSGSASRGTNVSVNRAHQLAAMIGAGFSRPRVRRCTTRQCSRPSVPRRDRQRRRAAAHRQGCARDRHAATRRASCSRRWRVDVLGDVKPG